MGMSADDYLHQLIASQPPGIALPVDAGSSWVKFLFVIGKVFADVDVTLDQLRDEVLADRINNFLAEWESMLSIDGSCIFSTVTEDDRKKAVHAKFTATGGANVQYFIERAAALGFTVTIDHPLPNVWRVFAFAQAEEAVADYAEADLAIRVWGAEVQMECIFTEINPAHLRLEFAYN